MFNAIKCTTGNIFKHYFVRIRLNNMNEILEYLSIECKNKKNQKKLFEFINHRYDDLKYGDILDLKLANEIIHEQRIKIKELKSEINDLQHYSHTSDNAEIKGKGK